ncbi:S1/P1 nuclease [Microbulbifer sp. ALW1]|uniref:S1/P1 nuclease n=1 Tax=Microbulbifer sp. (strain ALW1) TaxID=1516059 RepID=UPI00135C8C98|nr:S1/P1 nuclease [Microbulbifer sp. ALW1]
MQNLIRKALFAMALVLTVALPRPGFGWGADAHRATGEIAWQLLDADTQRTVVALLAVKGESSLAEAGTWADRIRGNENYNWAAPLHYINLPTTWEGYIKSQDCPSQGCIIEAIHHYRQQLSDKNLRESERAEALLFLVHFIEDLHQPMHTGLREDRGGNDAKRTFYGFETNLHALWDTYLPAGFLGDWQDFASAQVDQLSRKDLAAMAPGTPESWAEESHRLAHRNAYTDQKVLGEAYYQVNKPVVELRLRQGGTRLAAVLTAALKDG